MKVWILTYFGPIWGAKGSQNMTPGTMIYTHLKISIICMKTKFHGLTLKTFWKMAKTSKCFLVIKNPSKLEDKIENLFNTFFDNIAVHTHSLASCFQRSHPWYVEICRVSDNRLTSASSLFLISSRQKMCIKRFNVGLSSWYDFCFTT